MFGITGPQFREGIQTASPLLLALGAGLSQGKGTAYMPQGMAAMMLAQEQKAAKQKEEADRLAATQMTSEVLGSMGSPPASPPMTEGQQIAGDTMSALGLTPSKDAMIGYIRRAAAQRGIDPEVAVRVAQSEGLNANPADGWQSNFVKNGKRERSYGPFQLYVDGGLGNQFMESTGLDPSNPQTWKQQIDFALDHASKNGWGAWYGARNTGIGDMQGIGGRMSKERAAAVLSSPNVPDAIKQMVIAQFQPEEQPSTDDIKEYRFAVGQGYQGSLQQWMIENKKAGAASTTINNRTDPVPAPGFKNVYDENGNLSRQEMIPGGPAALKAEEDKAAADAKKAESDAKTDVQNQQASTSANIVLDDIGRAKKMAEGWMATGAGAALTQNVPGTEAYNLREVVKTIRGNIGFDRIQQMRAASPTGGALGQVSNQEIDTLQSVLGSLELSQDHDQFMYNLNRLENLYKGIQRKLDAYPQGGAAGDTSSLSDDELIGKYLDQ